jgi:AraC-like DNA-binding protein
MRSTRKAHPVLENTPHREWESFHCEVVRGSGYGAQWHFHPEHQLTLVLKSRGYRVVGDSLAPLASGDLVLVGSNLPHVWHQDDSAGRSAQAVHAIVIRFLDSFLGDHFLQRPELEPVRLLLRRAARGLQITGRTRDQVAERVMALAENRGLTRVIDLLTVLNLLAGSRDVKPLSSARFVPELKGSDQGRMKKVFRYIHANLTEEIDRDEAAARASLSPGAFSRFFKTRTGKTLPQYVNELRIGRACSMLAEADVKIADLALDCGFGNLANFNRQFQRVTGMSPTAYRREFQQRAFAN